MLTIEWQRLGISLGYDMPSLVADAGLAERYDEAIGRAEELYRTLAPDFPEQASYAVALAHASATSCNSTRESDAPD